MPLSSFAASSWNELVCFGGSFALSGGLLSVAAMDGGAGAGLAALLRGGS